MGSPDSRTSKEGEAQPRVSLAPVRVPNTLATHVRRALMLFEYTSIGWLVLFEVSVEPAGSFYLRLRQTTVRLGAVESSCISAGEVQRTNAEETEKRFSDTGRRKQQQGANSGATAAGR